MSSQMEKVQKSVGFDVGAFAAQSTLSVCLISVFFVHFVKLLGSFSDVNIRYQPPLTSSHCSYCIIIFCSFSSPCVTCFVTFFLLLLFTVIYIFLHTYSYKNVHKCFLKTVSFV